MACDGIESWMGNIGASRNGGNALAAKKRIFSGAPGWEKVLNWWHEKVVSCRTSMGGRRLCHGQADATLWPGWGRIAEGTAWHGTGWGGDMVPEKGLAEKAAKAVNFLLVFRLAA